MMIYMNPKDFSQNFSCADDFFPYNGGKSEMM